MLRKIIKIDNEKCNGCGLCVSACHEGAIGIVGGKAVLMRDDYCDGLGNCLPVCPTGAIAFEEREAAPFNETEVKKNMEPNLPCGCPGTNAKAIQRDDAAQMPATPQPATTQLRQWPVQIKLIPLSAPYLENANLLIAADCAAYAYGNFHQEFMRNKITIIGCPKLDEGDYSEKLTAILQSNNIKSVTVVRMEVPCCGGIENAVKTALKDCGKMIPWQTVTISTDGNLLD
jgi:ferredoxin